MEPQQCQGSELKSAEALVVCFLGLVAGLALKVSGYLD